jgi:hypothetical protein
MSLSIRPVNFAADHDELLCVLRRNLLDIPHEARLSWLYAENPAGPARSWFLCDESGTAVGVASLFPRAVWLGKTSGVCGQVGDFGIDASFRSLGPAIMLQRSTFEPVTRGDFAFCYDCPPHERGMAMFYRLGLKENCRMKAYAKPLRTERQLERTLGSTGGRIAARVANPLLRLASRRVKGSRELDFSLHTGSFGPEFSDLDLTAQSSGVIRNRRNAEDLNWRFRHNPLRQFEVLTARHQGKLVGYVVYSFTEEDVLVFDLFGQELSEVGPALLQALSSSMQGRRIQTIRALLTDGSAYASIFQRAGFSLRGDGARVVAFSGPQHAPLSDVQWQFQQSDIMA